MQERNVLQEVFTATLTLFTDLLEPVKWFILAAVCLIVADLKFGIEAARKRGEKIRTSRATRRSVNKLVDYICWILVAMSFGKVFGEPFADTPGIGAVGGLRLRDQFVFQQLLRSSGK